MVACQALGVSLRKDSLQAHLVWFPKYRKAILAGVVAIRVHDLRQEIAMEREQIRRPAVKGKAPVLLPSGVRAHPRCRPCAHRSGAACTAGDGAQQVGS
jgi:hypothetical protein